jgi:5-methylcytosine-specific restriction endonuclease McrA
VGRRIRQALWFGEDSEAEFPLEFEGHSPRVGDVVERGGQPVLYVPAWEVTSTRRLSETADSLALSTDRFVAAVHLVSGSWSFLTMDEDGWLDRLVLGDYTKEGHQVDHGAEIEVDGEGFRWNFEFIRDIDDFGRDYTWEARICVPPGWPTTWWTPAYKERSRSRARTSATTARHRRRVRIEQTSVERIDPLRVYQEAGWICGICSEAVNDLARFPDPGSASLDHITPLAAGGSHTRDNLQLAHLICNTRKGARVGGDRTR